MTFTVNAPRHSPTPKHLEDAEEKTQKASFLGSSSTAFSFIGPGQAVPATGCLLVRVLMCRVVSWLALRVVFVQKT